MYVYKLFKVLASEYYPLIIISEAYANKTFVAVSMVKFSCCII